MVKKNGETEILRVYHLDRGYDDLVGKPRSGAAATGPAGSRSVEPPAQLPLVGSRNDDSWFR